jgi:hypothetical protein
MQVDARNMFQGKNKRFIYHNKDHGTSSLKQHTFNEYLEVYKRWKLFLLYIVVEFVNERQVAK